MAAPVTHIILADKVYKKFFSNKNPKEFFIGTSFPDIRYMGVIDRSDTHFETLSMREIQEADSFNAGVKFHSMVDLVREDFLRKQGIYDLLPDSPFLTQAMKFYEDQLLYEKRMDWQTVIKYFDEVLNNEIGFGISEESVKKWHKFLQFYFSRKPDDQTVIQFVETIGKPKQMSEEILKVRQILESITAFKEVTLEMYDTFENLI